MNHRPAALFVMFSFCAISMARAESPPGARVEIEYLLHHIETSGCEFYRNGSWYDARRAEMHLRDQYQYLVGRDLIDSAEDFIDQAATRSSTSGMAYQLRCSGGATVPSGPWLHNALTLYRRAPQESQAPPAANSVDATGR
jgi:Family of unknown function (DUF5329)